MIIFVQGLWFGNRMEKTLINPNQSQDFVIQICDDSTDQNKSLGIEVDLIPISQCQWWGPHVDLLLSVLTYQIILVWRHN